LKYYRLTNKAWNQNEGKGEPKGGRSDSDLYAECHPGGGKGEEGIEKEKNERGAEEKIKNERNKRRFGDRGGWQKRRGYKKISKNAKIWLKKKRNSFQ